MNLITFFVGLLEPIAKVFSKYGVVKTFGYACILSIIFFVGYTSYCVINLDKRIDASVSRALNEQTEMVADQHAQGMERRVENIQTINSTLLETMYEVGADRTTIIEMHNGTNSTVGLPFIYGEMTYEQARKGISHVDDNYAKMNLTRYNFPFYMLDHSVFRGNMEELAKVDDKLAQKMIADGATYVMIYQLYGGNTPFGYYSIAWCGETNPNLTSDELSKINVCVQKMSNLLGNNN